MAGKKRPAEGNTYTCTWGKAGKGFRITVKGSAELVGEGASFPEARSALAECILLKTGDGEPVFRFDKALPKGVLPEELSRPEILWITGNDTAILAQPGDLYEGGICGTCGNPAGKRNAKPARLSDAPLPKSDGADARHVGSLFSEAFLKLLQGAGGPVPEFRRVEMDGKKAKPLFELAGRPIAETVSLQGVPAQGVQCAKCKRKVFHHMIGGEMIPVLAAEDLPARLPPWFLARNRDTLMLCMPGETWRSLQGKPGTANVVPVPIAVAQAEDVVRDPKLPLYKG